MGEAPVLLVERRGAVALLTLNRPERINAFTPELLAAIGAALDEAVADRSVRALVVTGAGRGFCSGQDIIAFAGLAAEDRDVARMLEEHYEPVIAKVRDCPLPIVAAVNGVAAGAGANFALLADIVVAGRSAAFVEAFGRLGLIPDVGGTWTLPRRIGEHRAKALCLTGEPLPAQTAHEWGLVWKLFDDERLVEGALALAAMLAAQSASAIALTKQAFRASADNSFERQIALERALQAEAGATGDHAEGAAAFIEKRAPRWSERG
ncbi:enoyl-CoA hydratase-related protein [Hansschlegelia zhihuaiae]|uniref:2-(1,2-epoxy-1,2-dihydrophenyl)acetyl-CoA isomerase n=1 Tax=Hansschlegelia zhihuaiae TaxID=405005 RepID=A0A4Q0M7Z7_9HYPH|nr:enoyl-CoA hydratase-related protein [Hansschlegelia zhihuaiae]RXF69250.1 2-(1,2-epoxy-1,2-dihydrophenyl)acetyl-CoA isomerase [Hansschlegelia zhihuaiae]